MIKRIKSLIFCLSVLFIISCSNSRTFYQGAEKEWSVRELPNELPSQTIFLIGDVGNPSTQPLEPSLALMRKKLMASDPEKTTVIFLGDNIYDFGLHKKDHPDRAEDERRINAQLDILKDFEGRIVFIPGNHDWKQGKSKGDNYVRRQEKYIEDYLDRDYDTFLPDRGCPGPVEIQLDEKLLLVLIDTQWWLHEHDKPKGDQDNCDVKDEGTFILQLQDVFRKNRDKQIIIAGHHPVYSNGNHGGYYQAKDHLFPLTAINDNLYIPLPVIGSIYPLYRGLLGDIQDIPHYKYQALRKSLIKVFDEFEDVIYVCGHEHNLQYQKQENAHYVVSGAGCKDSYVRHNNNLDFGDQGKGFASLQYFDNGSTWLEFYKPESEGAQEGGLIYRKRLVEKHRKLVLPDEAKETVSFNDSTVTVIPGGEYYEAGGLKKLIMGELYRDVWTTPIDVPVLDMTNEKGGLTPIKRGGGMQSRSLRLEAEDGHQYVLRSIQKFPSTVIPNDIKNTFVTEIVQDGIAASHPYASLVVPVLADAAGISHTNPSLVYVPDDPLLGDYRNEFSNLLCLFEERPKGDMRDLKTFGQAKKIISSPDMIIELHEDNRNRIDQYALLRARLFDMVIGDWDRHDDQWRWSSYKRKNGKGHIYRPIPRDRDQVFYKMDGVVPRIVNAPWAARLFEPFEYDIKDYTSLNFNARHLDRASLTELSREDWNAMADSLRAVLTDETFQAALNVFPEQVRKLHNERLYNTLVSRRDNLNESANKYYEILAEEVDVLGSYRKEYFEVIRLNDEQTQVNIYPRKNGKKVEDELFYSRTFNRSETDEIRLYGLDGTDTYHLTGEVNKGILVRIIGGPEVDTYVDSSSVKGWKKHTEIYDRREKKKKNKDIYFTESETRRFLTQKDDDAVIYERKAFAYDKLMPLAYLGFNPDDGVYLGGGFVFTKHGFNKSPYRYRHKLRANYAVATGAFNFEYNTRYTDIFHSKWDFVSDVDIAAPDFRFNFYGLGNEIEPITGDWRDNRLRINFFNLFTGLSRSSEGDVHTFTVGPNFLYVNPPFEIFEGDFEIPEEFEDIFSFKDRWYGGVKTSYYLENVNNKNNPYRGIRFLTELSWTKAIQNSNAEFVRLKSEVRFYMPFTLLPMKTTLALRSGVAANFGVYDFYQANFISGYRDMRGIRRNRYGGDVAFYNNADLRMKLFEWDNYILPVEFGLVGFGDIGRVWYEDDNSKVWHWAAGVGIYASPLNAVVINASYGISDDANVFTLLFGFLF